MPSRVNHELSVAIALFAVFSAPSPAFAQAPHADAEPVSAHVELVADTLPKDTRAAVELEFTGQLEAAVAELGLAVAESESAELVLRVEVGQPNHKAPVFVVHSVALHDGQVLERGDAQTCLRCTPTELVTAGLTILPRAAAQARTARPKPAPPPAPTRPVDPGPQFGPRPTPPGPTAHVGITLGTLGLVGAVAGSVLLNREELVRDPTGAVSDHGASGIALLSAGLTSMVAGVALLVLDVWVLAPHRQSEQARIELSYAGLRF